MGHELFPKFPKLFSVELLELLINETFKNSIYDENCDIISLCASMDEREVLSALKGIVTQWCVGHQSTAQIISILDTKFGLFQQNGEVKWAVAWQVLAEISEKLELNDEHGKQLCSVIVSTISEAKSSKNLANFVLQNYMIPIICLMMKRDLKPLHYLTNLLFDHKILATTATIDKKMSASAFSGTIALPKIGQQEDFEDLNDSHSTLENSIVTIFGAVRTFLEQSRDEFLEGIMCAKLDIWSITTLTEEIKKRIPARWRKLPSLLNAISVLLAKLITSKSKALDCSNLSFDKNKYPSTPKLEPLQISRYSSPKPPAVPPCADSNNSPRKPQVI
jgi:hypothetical protein